jgi:hypothetical protein
LQHAPAMSRPACRSIFGNSTNETMFKILYAIFIACICWFVNTLSDATTRFRESCTKDLLVLV